MCLFDGNKIGVHRVACLRIEDETMLNKCLRWIHVHCNAVCALPFAIHSVELFDNNKNHCADSCLCMGINFGSAKRTKNKAHTGCTITMLKVERGMQ